MKILSLIVCASALSACGPDGPGPLGRAGYGSAQIAANNGTVDYGACAVYPVKPGRSDQICNRQNGRSEQ